MTEGVRAEGDIETVDQRTDRKTVAGDTGHVALKSQDEHVQHEANFFFTAQLSRGRVEGSFRFGDIGPFLLPFETEFDIADTGEVFVEFDLVFLGEGAFDAAAINANEIEDTLFIVEPLEELLGRVTFLRKEGAVELDFASTKSCRVPNPRRGHSR